MISQQLPLASLCTAVRLRAAVRFQRCVCAPEQGRSDSPPGSGSRCTQGAGKPSGQGKFSTAMFVATRSLTRMDGEPPDDITVQGVPGVSPAGPVERR